jgi:hypothetical protein
MCCICEGDYHDKEKITCCKNVSCIPDTLVNLIYLNCGMTNIQYIPDTLVNLEELYCDDTKI